MCLISHVRNLDVYCNRFIIGFTRCSTFKRVFFILEARKTEDSEETARVEQKSGARRNKGEAEEPGKWIENFRLRKAVN